MEADLEKSSLEPENAIVLARPEVLAQLGGIGGSTLDKLIITSNFPKPVKFGRRSMWLKREVLEWVESQARKREAAA